MNRTDLIGYRQNKIITLAYAQFFKPKIPFTEAFYIKIMADIVHDQIQEDLKNE